MTSEYLKFGGSPAELSAPPNAWQQTTYRGETLTGVVGDNNELSDGFGGATLIGGGADDTFMISSSDTTIIAPASAGVDTVMAWCSFALPANVTNLDLESQNNTGRANGLGDLLIAVAGADTLVGGAGKDVFVDAGTGGDLFSVSRGGGEDVVYGFQASGANHDALQLTNFGFTSFAQVLAHATQVGSGVVLSLSATDKVILRDTEISALSAQDFCLQLDTKQLTLSFDDEFNSLSIYDSATGQGTWKTNFESGYQGESGSQAYTSRTLTGNDEQELYVDPNYQGDGATALGLNPFSVSNGVLTITASKAPSADVPALSGYKYTSGLLTTAKSFTQLYGYFEVRAALPTAKGIWPAFWLLPANGSWPPELDALESIGGNTVYQTMHTDSTGQNTYISAVSQVNNVHGQFHDYGVLWTATSISFYIDRVEVKSISTPSDLHTPMYMLLNLAVGGTWPGDVASGFTSAQMKVAYVRAYSLNDSPIPPAGAAHTDGAPAVRASPAATSSDLAGDMAGQGARSGRHTGAFAELLNTNASSAIVGDANVRADPVSIAAAGKHAAVALLGQYAAASFGSSMAAAEFSSAVGGETSGAWRPIGSPHAPGARAGWAAW